MPITVVGSRKIEEKPVKYKPQGLIFVDSFSLCYVDVFHIYWDTGKCIFSLFLIFDTVTKRVTEI